MAYSHTMAHMWSSDDSMEESVLSFHSVDPAIKHRGSDLMATAFTTETSQWPRSLSLPHLHAHPSPKLMIELFAPISVILAIVIIYCLSMA